MSVFPRMNWVSFQATQSALRDAKRAAEGRIVDLVDLVKVNGVWMTREDAQRMADEPRPGHP